MKLAARWLASPSTSFPRLFCLRSGSEDRGSKHCGLGRRKKGTVAEGRNFTACKRSRNCSSKKLKICTSFLERALVPVCFCPAGLFGGFFLGRQLGQSQGTFAPQLRSANLRQSSPRPRSLNISPPNHLSPMGTDS
jgi:hypothetical protein